MTKRPVYRSLNKLLKLCGVERKLFFFILLVAFALFQLSNALLSALMLFAVLWFGARAATEIDHQVLRIVINSSRFAARYDPAKREPIEIQEGGKDVGISSKSL